MTEKRLDITALEERIITLIQGAITHMGYDIVRVKLMDGHNKTLQVMVECQDGRTITVDDCEKVSKVISAVMDVDDPIAGHYDLEVSSPGIDRPLVRLQDFERFKGLEVKLSTLVQVEQRKHFMGRLMGLEGENVLLKLSDKEDPISIEFSQIRSAKLVLNKELLSLAEQSIS